MRKIIVVLLVMCAKIAQAQIYIDSYRFASAAPVNLLLDDYPGAAAAYSLRKLDKDYTGSAIRIRTAGGSETDIGFDSNGDLNTAAITTFCAGTTCTVATWYDQSGNNRHATQATAARQPTIYTGGAVVTYFNKPSIVFNSDFLSLPSSVSWTNNVSLFTVIKENYLGTATGLISYNSSPTEDPEIRIGVNGAIIFYVNAGYLYSAASSTATGGIYGLVYDNGNLKTYYNSNLIGQGTRSGQVSGFSEFRIGYYSVVNQYNNGYINELIVYNITTNEQLNIINNINSYYSIY